MRKIPAAVVAALVVQTGLGLIWAGGAAARIGTLEQRVGEQRLVAERLARLFDQAPEGVEFPYLALGRCESRPVAADGGGVEQRLTLTAVSLFAGSEEAKAVAAAVRACLHEARLEADGVRTATLRVSMTDVFRAGDGRRTYGVVRLRAVTEDVASG